MSKRRLIIIAVVLLIVVVMSKTRSRREAEWRGLTESEARSRLEDKLPSRIPDDKRVVITDRVVAKMRDRGVLRADTGDSDETVDLTDSDVEATESADA